MKIGYFLLLCFGFILGATCAFTGFRQYPIPPQDIDFKIMKRNAESGFACGYSDPFPEKEMNTGFAEGEALFKAQCAACHNRNMQDDLTGLALGDVERNWADYPREDLYNWIRNSQKMIADGHPRAIELWENWQPTVMNNFNFTEEKIEHLLLYIKLSTKTSTIKYFSQERMSVLYTTSSFYMAPPSKILVL